MILRRLLLIPMFLGFSAAAFAGVDQDLQQCHYDLRKEARKNVKCHEKVVRAYPDSPKAHYFLAVAYIYADDEKSTRTQFEELKRLDAKGWQMLLIDAVWHIKKDWMPAYEEDLKRLEEEERKAREKGGSR